MLVSQFGFWLEVLGAWRLGFGGGILSVAVALLRKPAHRGKWRERVDPILNTRIVLYSLFVVFKFDQNMRSQTIPIRIQGRL